MYHKCPLNNTEYRYIKRSFKEQQDDPVSLDDNFSSMFDMASPWVGTFNEYKYNKNDIKKNSSNNANNKPVGVLNNLAMGAYLFNNNPEILTTPYTWNSSGLPT